MQVTVKTKVEGFSGEYVLDVPGYVERIRLAKAAQFTNAENPVEPKEGLDLLIAQLEVLQSRVISIALVHEASGTEFKSLEQLEVYSEGQKVVFEMVTAIYNGVELGKN